MNKSGRFRTKKINFSQVSNIALRDENLSLKAKGLYSLIQSYVTLETFTIYKDFLVSKCKEGIKAFDGGWKELKDNGYLKVYRIPSSENKGKFEYEYDLLDTPDTDAPSLVNLKSDGSFSSNNESKTLENGQVNHTPQKGSNGESTIHPKKHPMLNGGNISNTDLNNTYCMYVSMYEKHLAITNQVKKLIEDVYKNIDIDLFERILVEIINNSNVSKKDSYFIKAIKEIVKKNISTIIQYDVYIDEYKNNKKDCSKTLIKNNSKSKAPTVKTRFHNINESFSKYSPDELERILQESQKGKF